LPGDAAIVGKLWKSTVNRMNWVKQLKLSSLSLIQSIQRSYWALPWQLN